MAALPSGPLVEDQEAAFAEYAGDAACQGCHAAEYRKRGSTLCANCHDHNEPWRANPVKPSFSAVSEFFIGFSQVATYRSWRFYYGSF
jgi:hypothetical protein